MEYSYYHKQVNRLHPFFLVYGAEAVLPTDMIHDSPRVTAYVEEDAEEARQDGLDILEEEIFSSPTIRHLSARSTSLSEP